MHHDLQATSLRGRRCSWPRLQDSTRYLQSLSPTAILLTPTIADLSAPRKIRRFGMPAAVAVVDCIAHIHNAAPGRAIDLQPLKRAVRAMIETSTTHDAALRHPAYRQISRALTKLARFVGKDCEADILETADGPALTLWDGWSGEQRVIDGAVASVAPLRQWPLVYRTAYTQEPIAQLDITTAALVQSAPMPRNEDSIATAPDAIAFLNFMPRFDRAWRDTGLDAFTFTADDIDWMMNLNG